MANLLLGKPVADRVDERSIKDVEDLNARGINPTLAIFKVGNKDNDSAYEKGIDKKSGLLGINVVKYTFDENVSEDEFYSKLDEANKDNNIHGILVFRPLPKRFDDNYLRNYINVDKDIDGSGDLSLAGVFTNKELGFAPCTAKAVMEILDYYNIPLEGKNVVVLGRSLVIGKPVSMLLLNKHATVTTCHSKTNNIEDIASKADILVCAIGKMESIDSKYTNPNQTIIDVGISYNEVKQKLCGDILFEDVEDKVLNITPVPRGVGSVTTSVLLNNVVEATKRVNE